MIAREARSRAVSEHRDLVIDQVCSSPRKTAALVDELVASGYRVSVVENVFDADGSSRPRPSVEALLRREPCPVAAWRRYDATVPGAPRCSRSRVLAAPTA